jgi:hypothetical protein
MPAASLFPAADLFKLVFKRFFHYPIVMMNGQA